MPGPAPEGFDDLELALDATGAAPAGLSESPEPRQGASSPAIRARESFLYGGASVHHRRRVAAGRGMHDVLATCSASKPSAASSAAVRSSRRTAAWAPERESLAAAATTACVKA